MGGVGSMKVDWIVMEDSIRTCLRTVVVRRRREGSRVRSGTVVEASQHRICCWVVHLSLGMSAGCGSKLIV